MELLVNILFDGLAYAMVLYVIAVGLSVTMGLLGIANLAHGVFAMAGGYISLTLMNAAGAPFWGALIVSFLAVTLTSVVLERLLYRHLYGAGELDQTLLSIGLIFVATGGAHFIFGPLPQRVDIPHGISGHLALLGYSFPTYRAFLIAIGFSLFVGLLAGPRSHQYRSAHSRCRRQSVYGAVHRHRYRPPFHAGVRTLAAALRHSAAALVPTSSP